MALNIENLKADLEALVDDLESGAKSDEEISETKDKFVNGLAAAIDKYVRTATVTVNTNVSGAAGPYPVLGTGTGSGTIS